MKIGSDGGPTEYYDFPDKATTLNDLIEYKAMSFAQGNIFKAAYRMGNKEGISLEYDLKKIKYYADRMLGQIYADRNQDRNEDRGCGRHQGSNSGGTCSLHSTSEQSGESGESWLGKTVVVISEDE